jgi:biopolymer transport protein ExbB
MRIHFAQSVAGCVLAAGMCLGLMPAAAAAQAVPPASSTATGPAELVVQSPTVAAAGNTPTTQNPYGIEALWNKSDPIAKGVLALLAIMSMASWYITVVKFMDQRSTLRQAQAAAQVFWSARSVEQGAQALEPGSPFSFIAEAATHALKKHDGLVGRIPLNDWISMGIARAVERVQRNTRSGLSALATVGSISPFVGLFGTVWGIYHALTAIGMSGQASIDKVAGPVGEALIMTAVGLAVAVPAVLAYNWLVGRNKVVMDEVRAFAQDLQSVVLSTSNSDQA